MDNLFLHKEKKMKFKCISTGSTGNCYTLTSDSGETLIRTYLMKKVACVANVDVAEQERG